MVLLLGLPPDDCPTELVEVTLIFLVLELDVEPLGVLRTTIVDLVPKLVGPWFYT